MFVIATPVLLLTFPPPPPPTLFVGLMVVAALPLPLLFVVSPRLVALCVEVVVWEFAVVLSLRCSPTPPSESCIGNCCWMLPPPGVLLWLGVREEETRCCCCWCCCC